MEQQDEQTRQAKLEALRNLRDKGFYEPEMDNPEGLNLDAPNPNNQAMPMQPDPRQQAIPLQPNPGAQAAAQPEQTMQPDPQMLMDALKRKREQELMKSLFPQNGQERQ